MKGTIAVLIIVGLFVGFVHLFLYGWHVQIGQGEHTGYITAVETNGIFFKTGTAYVKSDTQSSQEDVYCVADKSLLPQLTALSEQKAHVSVSYVDWLVKGFAYCNGEDAVITGVQQDTN